jgi:branched-subunit amino acid aminotransferase/4-amino-4-deoxychorismate lyase
MSDLPTPPAPGDRTGNGFDVAARALGFPAPGGREGLRAEDGTDPVAQDVARRLRAEMERLRESRDRWKAAHDARCDEVREAYEEGKRDGAALAARDTDQGARDALAEVRALADEALEMNSPPHATNSEVVWLVESIRAALARATPEGGEGK